MDATALIAIVPIVLAVGLIVLMARKVTDGEARPMDVAAAIPVVIVLFLAVMLIGSSAGGGDDPDDPIDPDDPEYPDYPASSGYLYAIYTDASGQEIQKVTASLDGGSMRRVSETRTADDMGASGIPSYWRFDAETGTGPFGSWYGAFNASDYDGTESEAPVSRMPGKLAYRLDPYDLSTTLAGESLSGTYNVFLVVPTVYWKAEGSVLYMSSDAEYSYGGTTITGMSAYAHTAVSGDSSQVYPYIGIGVYEASVDGIGLRSQSGTSPAVSSSQDQFKAQADLLEPSDGCDYQQWNYYQWTLYKMMAYTVMGTKSSQLMMGDGPVSNASSSTTGLADSAGPYAASTSDYDKLFVENAWGSVWDMIGDAMFTDYGLKAGQTLGGADLGSQAAVSGAVLPSLGGSNQWIASSSSASAAWDLPSATITASNSDDPAFCGDKLFANSGDRCLIVGGARNIGAASGLSALNANNALNASRADLGTRLAYVFDESALESDA